MFGFNVNNFNPVSFIGFMLGFVIGTTFHEFMHAYTALLLGDDLPKRQGRISLNPAMHFDPFGFFMGVLLALGIPALAWGRPVMVNPYALKGGRRGMALVAVAGPLANLAFATALLPIIKFGEGLPAEVVGVASGMISINLLLFSFNLIPIPPLDGFNILVGILPNPWTVILEPIRQYSLPILLGLIFFVPYAGQLLGFPLNPISVALTPVQYVLHGLFFGTT
jgi:Zn-dependent protease